MPTSVMPKGVEHSHGVIALAPQHAMPTSVMPKGVEHDRPEPGGVPGQDDAHLCDAERR